MAYRGINLDFPAPGVPLKVPALAEMSRWKTLEHALPAFILTGRVAGLSEQQIQDAWTRGDRESVIAAATGKKKN